MWYQASFSYLGMTQSNMLNILHDLSATGMGVALGVLMLLIPRLIKDFPRAFYIYSYANVVMLLVATATVIYFGLRRSMRYTAQEVEVDLDASIFEDVLPLQSPEMQTIDEEGQVW